MMRTDPCTISPFEIRFVNHGDAGLPRLLSGDGQPRNSTVVRAGTEAALLGELDEVTLFPLCGSFIFFPYFAEERV
ncbi:hypothetical protein DPMN_021200 [Dreissena polymorpha]|uniref:Uncharacterized protein n=1 Tax=Dreissena polymorpha TaxID=45954 RepID=A0A9D4S9R7_DREPO|nr:hypothetical protein DPMN_021200 [Dreissena polymorpha]